MEEIRFAYIAGSATRGTKEQPLKFPEELIPDAQEITVIEDDIRYKTPWGETVPMRVLEVDDAQVIWCPIHNWQKGFSGTKSSLQLFSVFNQLGVRYIILDATVGGIEPLKPWDLVIPHGFTAFNDDLSELALCTDLPVFIRMAEPLCPCIRQLLLQAAPETLGPSLGRISDRGIYVSKPQGRFETPAEIRVIKHWRNTAFSGEATVLGESLGLDAEGARRIGAHAAELCLVANHAEGTSPDKRRWVEGGRENFYKICPPLIAPIMLQALRLLVANPPTNCNCRFYWENAVLTSTL